MLKNEDFQPPLSQVAGTADIPAINTEIVLFDTTRIKVMGGADQDNAAYATRRCRTYIKTAFLSVWADQVVTLFHKHLCGAVVAPDDSSWDVVADSAGAILGKATTASKLFVLPVHFFGDDHRLTLKTGGTAPTILRVSLRFGLDQSASYGAASP